MKAHYHVHRSPSLNPVLSQMNPVLILTAANSFKINFYIILPSTSRFPKCSHFQFFRRKFCLRLSQFFHPSHHSLLIIVILFIEASHTSITVLWDVMSYSSVDGYQCFGETCRIFKWRRQQISLKRWHLQGVRFQKTVMLIAQELFNDSFPMWAVKGIYKGDFTELSYFWSHWIVAKYLQ
jgi:hypothetical protein